MYLYSSSNDFFSYLIEHFSVFSVSFVANIKLF